MGNGQNSVRKWDWRIKQAWESSKTEWPEEHFHFVIGPLKVFSPEAIKRTEILWCIQLNLFVSAVISYLYYHLIAFGLCYVFLAVGWIGIYVSCELTFHKEAKKESSSTGIGSHVPEPENSFPGSGMDSANLKYFTSYLSGSSLQDSLHHPSCPCTCMLLLLSIGDSNFSVQGS